MCGLTPNKNLLLEFNEAMKRDVVGFIDEGRDQLMVKLADKQLCEEQLRKCLDGKKLT